MVFTKLHWKRWVFLAITLVMVVSLFVGCGEAEEEKPTILIADNQYQSIWIENAIAEYIIEKGYGYPTEELILDTPVLLLSLSNGDIHICMEMWHQNYVEWWEEQTTAGNIEPLALILEGGPQFWMIPQWVHEEYNINTIDDMKDHWELFKDPEDPTKGAFINSKIGWKCTVINEIKVEGYGLTDNYNVITAGSAGAADAVLMGAQKKHEPVFGYYWAPTALMGMYDWYILEEPEYDEEVWAKVVAAVDDESLRPVDEACEYPSQPIPICIHRSLRDIAPDVVAMLEKMVIGLDRVNKAAAWAEENQIGDEWDRAAVWFLREYDSLWKTWVTTDAYNKVKNALAEED